MEEGFFSFPPLLRRGGMLSYRIIQTKRRRNMKALKGCLLFTAAAILFGSGAAHAASDVVTLKVEHFLPTSSNFHQQILVPWCDKINKESGGKLKCQIYPSMQLGGTPSQLFDQVRDGI